MPTVKISPEELFSTLEESQKLYASLDAKEVVAIAFGLAQKLLGANRLVVGLKESGERLKIYRVPPARPPAGGGSRDEPEIYTMEGARLAQLRIPYQAVVVSDGALRDLAAQLEIPIGTVKEGLLCPLEVEGHPMGFFLIAHLPASSWTEVDVERAILLCGPLAQALENARFHRQLAKFSDESLAVAYEKLKAAYEELQHMQSQLLNTEKLNVVGKLASSVAHQLRNPLGVIKASAQLLLTKVLPLKGPADGPQLQNLLKPEGLLKERLDAIHRNAVHADNIITELLQVARPRPTGPLEPLPVHLVLNEAIKMVESKLLDAGITLHKNYGELPSVMGSAHHLQQVFMNFLMNALEAMSEKGSITLTTRIEGARLLVVVQDTGEGFTPQALEKVAQPFFTTKSHGVGLGMFAAKQILEAHGGTLLVESAQGKGTTITVALPIASAVQPPKPN